MNKNLSKYISNLLDFSLGSRILLQLFLLIALVFIPYFFPGIINLENSNLIALNVTLTLGLNIVFEIFKHTWRKKTNSLELILNIQIFSNAILLTWFLHIFGGINGPFFILYPLLIIESAFAPSIFIRNLVFWVLVLSTLSEYTFLIFSDNFYFDLYPTLLFFVRVTSLFMVKKYGEILNHKIDEGGKEAKSLTEINKHLKLIDEKKDEFLYMAAHELRTPVTAIKGYVSMILEGDAGEIPPKARGFLADVNNINDRLIRLLNNMLNVSKIEEGKLVYQMDNENLSQITRSVFSQFIPETERKGINYKLLIPRKIKDLVYVDSDKIQEVIGNLISNAVKYTDSGNITVRLLQTKKMGVRFEVEDTGPGISEKEQEKLFQKFYRVESNVGKTTGSGLGLYICKLLIEKFHGTIGVTSVSEKGSTFWFELPLASRSIQS